MTGELILYTSDGRVRYVDPDSVKLVGRWGRKWLAAADSEGPTSCLISLDEVVAVEQDIETGEEDE